MSGTGPRAVVTTASYEARKYGVGSAMPAARARRLCPHAVFLAPDFPTYREVSRRVMELVRAHVERVEVVGLDEAYLDISGLHSPHAAMRRLVADIKRATQLTCSVGIGPNKLVAKVASDAEKPAGFVVLTREQACARFAGVAARARARHRPQDRRAPGRARAEHARRSSRERPSSCWWSASAPTTGASCRRRARFEHDSQIGAARKVVSESRERTFDRDVSDFAALAESLARDDARAVRSLARNGRRGRTIGIKVRLDDWTTVTRARTIAAPTCDYDIVFDVALALLRKYAPPRPVRLLGVRVAGLARDEPRPVAPPERAQPRAPMSQIALPL